MAFDGLSLSARTAWFRSRHSDGWRTRTRALSCSIETAQCSQQRALFDLPTPNCDVRNLWQSRMEQRLRIARDLIGKKLSGQEQVARTRLLDSLTADTIARYKAELPQADCISTIRLIESQAARAFWSAWSTLPINFPKKDLPRVPEHWRSFGTRVSPLTGSPRFAVNPPNAILNYLYCVLESEARLAAAALGLDPGLGVMHVDTPARDSLACDLMEPVRSSVDSYLLDWITRQPLRREWFFEQRDGNCRLMAPFAVRLSETASIWRRAVAPVAEWVAKQFWSTTQRRTQYTHAPTHLTQTHRRAAKGVVSEMSVRVAQPIENLCPGCGKRIRSESKTCVQCGVPTSTKNMLSAARIGRRTANGPEAQVKRATKARKNALAQHSWKESDQPAWLTPELFAGKSSLCCLAFRCQPFGRHLEFPTGMRARFEKDTDRTRGTGGHWRNWLASGIDHRGRKAPGPDLHPEKTKRTPLCKKARASQCQAVRALIIFTGLVGSLSQRIRRSRWQA